MRNLHMTYIPSRKGWMKEYQGRKYAVSCKQLGMPPTKEQSWMAANLWWEEKLREFEAENKPASLTVLERIRAVLGGHDIPVDLARQLLAIGQEETVLTVGEAFRRRLERMRDEVAAKLIDVGRYEGFENRLKGFVSFVGQEKNVRCIDKDKLESYWRFLVGEMAAKRLAPSTAKNRLADAKQFISFCYAQAWISLPSNMKDKRLAIKIPLQAVKTIPVEDIQQALLCKSSITSDKAKLYMLLGLNCGMYQSDISDLGVSEVDFENGIITRSRTKVSDGIVTRYKLWKETLALLKKYKTDKKVLNERGDYRVLLSRFNTPLTEIRLVKERVIKKDCIRQQMPKLWKAAKAKYYPFKLLRKTSATLLSQHSQYKYYVDYFLSHIPGDVTSRHYVQPHDEEFFLALDWLRKQALDFLFDFVEIG